MTRLFANEIVAGLGYNVAVAGLIGFVLKEYYRSSGTLRLEDVVMLPHVVLPGIAAIPVLGAILSGKDPLTWLAWLSVPASAFVLRRTRAGLRLRAAGEAPAASVALGLRPLLTRDLSTVIAGAMAGLAGRSFPSASSAYSASASPPGAASSRWRRSISAATGPG